MQLSREREAELIEQNMPKIYRSVDNFMARYTGKSARQASYDDCVQDALVEGYDQNADFYTLLLNNEEVRSKIANVFLQEIYKILKDEKEDD